ncbi:MAG: hypothetical protein M1370_10625 [Bacteroidetes bacterium]|nr:hypothetical protein [Bacteroidota bacterium]MCL5026510.1 hypothetical protein [Chloroflexota bacterium]
MRLVTVAAVALRPNAFIQSAGLALELGTLTLGQTCHFGPLPYGAPGTPGEGQPDEGQ